MAPRHTPPVTNTDTPAATAPVADADGTRCFAEQPRETNTRGGRHVEFGLAVADEKRIILVGPRENVFHFLPVVENFRDWAALRKLLGAERAAAR